MRRLNRRELLLEYGKPLKVDVVSDDGDVRDNFYLLKFLWPTFNSKDKLEYKETYHLLTENEINEAAVRYYCDSAAIDNAPRYAERDIMHGYIGPVTYVNNEKSLTTRFSVKIKGIDASDMSSDRSYFVFFTAREIKRSQNRAYKEFKLNSSWISLFVNKLKNALNWTK